MKRLTCMKLVCAFVLAFVLLCAPVALAEVSCNTCGTPIATPSEVTLDACVWTCGNPDCSLGGIGEQQYFHFAQAEEMPCDQSAPCWHGCGTMIQGSLHSFHTHVSNGDGTHRLRCDNPQCDKVLIEKTPCAGGGATCASPSICYTCAGLYGEKDENAHIWGEWLPEEEGTHALPCLRLGCFQRREEACELWTAARDGENAITVCPLCGGTNAGLTLAAVETAQHSMVHGKWADGKLLVREGTLSPDMRVVTVAFADESGIVPNEQSKYEVVVPLVAGEFELVRVDADGAREKTPFTYTSGLLRFEVQGSGLYLLLPAA